MANSPGGILADTTQGQPPVFISAGLQDNIFPIQQAGNAVRRLCLGAVCCSARCPYRCPACMQIFAELEILLAV